MISLALVAGLGALKPPLALLGLVYAVYMVIFLAILCGGHLLLRTFRRKPRETRLAELQFSSSGSYRDVVKIGVLGAFSVVLAFAAGFLSKMSTPGWWIAGTLGNLAQKFGFELVLWLFLAVPIVDAAIFFAVLWGGYRLWKGFQRGDHAHGSKQRAH